MGETLIQIAGQESNQRWMNIGIGIQTVNDVKQIAMSNRDDRGRRGRWRRAPDRFKACIPQAMHGSALGVLAFVSFSNHS